MDSPVQLREQIIDAALELAAADGWEAVRLHAVADRLGVSLDAIRRHFAEKEEVVDAFLDRADAAMLARAQADDLAGAVPRERLRALLLAWFAALAPWRRTVRDMLGGKLEPGHLHVQLPGLLRVSRTVQWWREGAGLDAVFLRRALEETALSSLFLATLVRWLNDDSEDAKATAEFLDRGLELAEATAQRLGDWGRPEAGREGR